MNFVAETEIALRGKSCHSFRLVEGGSLILFLHEGGSAYTDTTRLCIDSAWRIGDSSQLLVGSLDHPDNLLSVLEGLRGKEIIKVEADARTGDLSVEFLGGTILTTFSYSREDEQWEVRRDDGYRLRFGPAFEPSHVGPVADDSQSE